MRIFNPQWTPSPQDGYEKVPMLCDRRTAEVNGLLWLAGQCWSQMSSMLNRGRSLMIFFKLLSLLEVLYLSFFETAWLQVSRLPIDEERERSCIHNFYDVVFLWCLSVSKIWSRTPRRLSPIKILTRRHIPSNAKRSRERGLSVYTGQHWLFMLCLGNVSTEIRSSVQQLRKADRDASLITTDTAPNTNHESRRCRYSRVEFLRARTQEGSALIGHVILHRVRLEEVTDVSPMK